MTTHPEILLLQPLALGDPLATLDAARAATVLSVALGCGLLVGLDRERRKGDGPDRAFAGLRTFALASLLGATAALTGWAWLVAVGAAFVAALGLVAYWRDRSEDPGVTTELALLLTYLIGVLCLTSLPLAAGLAMGLTALLAGRERMHRFVRHWLRPGEVRDGLILAALVLMVLPLMPDRPLWGDVLNPHLILQLLALLLALQSLAHLGRRLLQARHAVALSSVASGFVSSTATIATLGLSVRDGQAGARLMAGGGLLSCVSTQLQLLLVAAAVQPGWLASLWAPALASAAAAGLWGLWLVRGAPAEPMGDGLSSPRVEGMPVPGSERMFSLKGAAAVAALLSGIQALVYGLGLLLGERGVLVGALLGALADLHASLAAVFVSMPPGDTGHWAVALALVVHATSKTLTAAFSGGGRYVAWLAPGLWAHTGLAVVWLGLV